MRPSSRPDVPPQPQAYRTQVLEHLGLIAGLFADLGLTEGMAQATQPNPARRLVTGGHAVTAMVLHGLGFVNHQRYLVPPFFHHKPLPRRSAPGLQARYLHDAPLGRARDTLDETGLTELYSLLAATAAKRLGLAAPFPPLAPTSFPVAGRSHSEETPTAQGVHLPHGSRRAPRPDLHQGMLEGSVEPPAGLPVLMQPLSGNSSEAQAFGHVLREPRAHLHPTYGAT